MDKSRLGGALLCIITIVFAGLFFWGIIAGKYWAWAVPVSVGVAVVLALAFWIGWTMVTTAPPQPPKAPEEKKTP